MALTITDDSATIGTTEWFLASDSGTKVDQTTDCETQLMLNVGALAAGDTYEVRLYETINGTQRSEVWTIGGVTSGLWISPMFKVGNGWEWSLKKLAGTDRAIGWSIRNDTGGGGDATAANQTAILARLPAALVGGRMDSNVQAMANDVITAAAIAADAIGSSELAASAVTEIQSGLATSANQSTIIGYIDTEIASILSNLSTATGYIDTEVASIKAVTDGLGATLSTIAGYIDTEVASIKSTVEALPSAAAIATAVFDYAFETGETFVELVKDVRAIFVGDAEGLEEGSTTATFKDSTGVSRVVLQVLAGIRSRI